MKDNKNLLDIGGSLELCTPEEFDFKQCLIFLGRSEKESLHVIKDDAFYKLIKIDQELVLLKVTSEGNKIRIEFPAHNPSEASQIRASEYIWELFDLDRNLKEFYATVYKDRVLSSLTGKYFGLRIIGIPDLFEALTWAIIGQQINLSFAYSLKKDFVEHFGEKFLYEGETFWLYPTHEAVSQLQVSDLTTLKFTTRKAEYVIGVAKEMNNGALTKEKLLQKESYEEVKNSLVELRGIGSWSADYAIMKCLKYTKAFPIADVGLHNAIKAQLRMDRKPTIEEIEKLALSWKGWEAYATFYLWRSLYD